MAFSDLTDRALKACRTTFGESVSYTPSGGSPATIQGVFNAKTVMLEDGVPVQSKIPTLMIRLADLGEDFSPSRLDTVVIRGVTYGVKEIDEDGEGGAHLELKATT